MSRSKKKISRRVGGALTMLTMTPKQDYNPCKSTKKNVNVDIKIYTENTEKATSSITPIEEGLVYDSDTGYQQISTPPRPATATVVYDPEHSQKIEQTIEDTVVMLSDPAILNDSNAIEYLEGEINKLHLEARAKLLQDDRIPNEVREFISAM